jgi:hypothetical protein
MKTFLRFLADETAGTGRDYLTTASIVGLFAAGTIFGARMMIADKLDAVVAALKKTPGFWY